MAKYRFKIILLFILFMFLFCIKSEAVINNDYLEKINVVGVIKEDKKLYVQDERMEMPNKNKTIQSIRKNHTVKVIRCIKEEDQEKFWYYIKYDNTMGWIQGQYIEILEPYKFLTNRDINGVIRFDIDGDKTDELILFGNYSRFSIIGRSYEIVIFKKDKQKYKLLYKVDGDAYGLIDIEIMDIDNDKKSEIITKWYDGGSGAHCFIVIIKYDKNEFRKYKFGTIGDCAVKNNIKDLNRDGKYEMITTERLCGYHGGMTTGSWDTIYSWSGEKWIDDSKKFPQYYKERYLSYEYVEHDYVEDKNFNSILKSGQNLVVNKAKRIVNPGSKAGLESAIQEIENEYSQIRLNSIYTIVDIGDPINIKYLIRVIEKILNTKEGWENKMVLEEALDGIVKLGNRSDSIILEKLFLKYPKMSVVYGKHIKEAIIKLKRKDNEK